VLWQVGEKNASELGGKSIATSLRGIFDVLVGLAWLGLAVDSPTMASKAAAGKNAETP